MKKKGTRHRFNLSSVVRFLFNLLPASIRIFTLRRAIRISPPPENFIVQIASECEDLERAYILLHDCYVGMGLMDADPSGLRLNFFSFLPSTTTIIAKVGKDVVGTVTLIKDSPSGLPSDHDFQKENDELRVTGHSLVEVSALAIDPRYRKKSHLISIYLMKFLQHYSTHLMGCTTVSCVVHPRARDFYNAFWGFKANKKIVKYQSVNGALGVHVYGEILDLNLHGMLKNFPNSPDRNPIAFLFKSDERLVYPQRKIAHQLDPIFNPLLLRYFLLERTNAATHLSYAELVEIYSAYCPYFNGLDSLPCFKNFSSKLTQYRVFRFPTRIPAEVVDSQGQKIKGFIVDLSHAGAFVATAGNMIDSDVYKLVFELNSQQFTVPATMRWHNRRQRNRQEVGYGFYFKTSQLGIARILKQTHLTESMSNDQKQLKFR